MKRLIRNLLCVCSALINGFAVWLILFLILATIYQKIWPDGDCPGIFIFITLFFPIVVGVVCFRLVFRRLSGRTTARKQSLFTAAVDQWSRILDRFTERNVTSESDWAALSSGQVKEAGEARVPLGGTSASSALPSQPPVVPPRNTIGQELARVDAMDGHTFEHWCAALLEKVGFYNVSVTRASGDQGVDVVATKDGVKYAIQCKCYSSDLGNKPIQEVNAGKVIYHCHIGVVMTNRHFTAGAKEAAEATNILLWDRDTLVRLMKMRR